MTTGLNYDQEHRTCSLTISILQCSHPHWYPLVRHVTIAVGTHMPTTEKEDSKMFVTHQFFVHRLYRDMAAAPASSGSDWNRWTICISWNIPSSSSPQPFNGTKCHTSNMLEKIADSQCIRQGCDGHATFITSYHYTAGHTAIFLCLWSVALTHYRAFTFHSQGDLCPQSCRVQGFYATSISSKDVRRHGSRFYIQCSCHEFMES